jgi:glutathione S-transferase
MATHTPKLRLTYFDSKGRAQPIRICLRIAKLEFEDERLPFPVFGEKKAAGEFPLGQLPVLSIDGKVYCQSQALTRWAARKAGLYPADELKALVVEEIVSTINDASASLPYRTPGETEESFKPKREAWFPAAARFWKFLEARLAEHGGPFFLGKELSFADLVVFTLVDSIQAGNWDHVPVDVFTAYPSLLALHKAVGEDPLVAAANV